MPPPLDLAERVGRRLCRDLARAAELPDDVRRWASILRAPRTRDGGVRVSYGVERLPGADDLVVGGAVKLQRLASTFPNEPRRFDLLYLGSSSMPRDLRQQLWLARRRGASVVWNQDGVATPGWAGSRWRRLNLPQAAGLHAADHVFFQSEFCKRSSDLFLGPPEAPWEVLYNAVDTHVFTPAVRRPDRPLTLVLAGSQYQWYRLETALRAFAAVLRERADARLRVTGRLWTIDRREAGADARRLAELLGVADRVVWVGPYAQRDAPDLMRSADILVHTKYNDPCPGVVIEAMACGLPVVYSASGGVPELVGNEAGIGVPAPEDFEHDHPPDPEALAAAVLAVASDLAQRAEAARERAVERFDLCPWVERHRVVFEELVSG